MKNSLWKFVAVFFGMLIFLSLGCTTNTPKDNLNTSINTSNLSVPVNNNSNNNTMDVNVTSAPISLHASKKISDGINRFALSFYNEIGEDKESVDENIFFSPFSMYSALSLVYEGANGTTKKEMTEHFYMIDNNTIRQSSFKSLNQNLVQGSGDAVLNVANALWIDKGFNTLKEYRNVASVIYSSEINNVDFSKEKESLNQINGWVNDKTNGKIPTILNSIPQATKLVITNAIYFNGKWETAFDKNDTYNSTFYLSKEESNANNNINATFMTMRPRDRMKYYGDDNVQVLELPYQNSSLAMDIFLPVKNSTQDNYIQLVHDFETELSETGFDYYTSSLTKENIDYIKIPKFKFLEKYDCVKYLESMGVKSLFNPSSADLSGIDNRKDLNVGKVVHKAYIDVKEEGTEAAAATAVVIVATAYPRQEDKSITFVADYPFLFIIRDTSTNTILFMGRIIKPEYKR